MKVLWITNTLFPDLCAELKIEVPVIGGWMFSSAKGLLEINTDIQLAVVTTYNGDKFKEFFINGITYFLLPISGSKKKYNPYFETCMKNIHKKFSPEIIHIHGTEYPVGLAYIRACGKNGVVISIQGLVSVYERYYFGGIEEKDLKKNTTLRDYIRNDSFYTQRYDMQNRGTLEREYINGVDHVIGRTCWDKSHVWAINSAVQYHFCNETLRNGFYQNQWKFDNCEKHSIFLSQAHYPIKGLHQMIKALPLILKHFPNTMVYVAGTDFLTNKGWRINGYGKYISSLIKGNGVDGKIIFTGILNEDKMIKQYLQSHVFVCPSSIENSPNSIGEAQLLGVPCISSIVGGVTSMINDGFSGLLYRFEEVEMLAMKICQLFSDTDLANTLSINAREIAINRHDKLKNASTLNNIYNMICNNI